MNNLNIVFTRVDNRLIHGQVGNVWLGATSANLIAVVDEETSKNKVIQQVMKMTTDARGVQVRFYSPQQAINTLPKASSMQKIFIVAKTPHVIRQLVEGGIPIKQCNIGNMHFKEGKKMYKESHIYVDQDDLDDIQYLKDHNVDVYIQVLPTENKIEL